MKTTDKRFFEHAWVKTLTIVVSIGMFLAICYFLKGVLISLLLAFTVAYIFDPVVDFIEHRKLFLSNKHIPRSAAIAVLITTMTLIGGGILTYAIPKTISGGRQVVVALRVKYPDYQKWVEGLIEKYGQTAITAILKPQLEGESEFGVRSSESKVEKEHPELKRDLLEAIPDLKKYAPHVIGFVFGAIKRVFYSTFGFIGMLTNFIIFSVVSIYLLKDFDPIKTRIRELIPLTRRQRVVETVSKVDDNLRGFFRGQITVCMILSLIYSIGLTIAGVPLAFLIGFIGGIGNIVPYLGTIAGITLGMLLSLIQHHDLRHLIYVVMVFGIGQLLDGTLLTPKIVGGRLGLSPVVIIVSILIWSQLLGFLGLLLAVPITSVAKVFIDELIAKYKASVVYKGSEPK
ncbi:MAG TPA: AI-2E family transporter [Candidatus Brocadiia bacterium]|nr:AI-2E family transporter [Candidatus Brocadiales bacterium]